MSNLDYDDNGNLVSDTNYTYVYDYANRLIEVKEGQTSIATFKYDALGRRIEKVTTNGTIHYYYDGGRVIEECDGADNDALQKTYTYGNRVDEILTMETITGTYYYHENTLGSIYAVTDEDGNVVERYEYTIYGIPIFFDATGTEISGTAISNNYLYTGREYDPEIGLYNYRARYYSPDLGRFLGRDPIGYVDGMNLYEYVGSNPGNYIDPLGLCKDAGGAGTIMVTWMSSTPSIASAKTKGDELADKIDYVTTLLIRKHHLCAENLIPALDYTAYLRSLSDKEAEEEGQRAVRYAYALYRMVELGSYAWYAPPNYTDEELAQIKVEEEWESSAEARALTRDEVLLGIGLGMLIEDVEMYILGGVTKKVIGFVGRKFVAPAIGKLSNWAAKKGAEEVMKVMAKYGPRTVGAAERIFNKSITLSGRYKNIVVAVSSDYGPHIHLFGRFGKPLYISFKTVAEGLSKLPNALKDNPEIKAALIKAVNFYK